MLASDARDISEPRFALSPKRRRFLREKRERDGARFSGNFFPFSFFLWISYNFISIISIDAVNRAL